MNFRFDVELLDGITEFLDSLDEKTREKIFYNIWKSRMVNDSELFKKLSDDIWEFRTLYKGNHIRLLSFWDKNSKIPKIVVCTHGFVKKDWKVPKQEIEKARSIMKIYYSAK
ncbi:MAG: type II toxin-antitoxin system RelE/ParE family toxin [Bacteroidales bacterium]|nr:type II toxin-antitoxin system RelE/ParE family toxin [Bacteroidales bacterium]